MHVLHVERPRRIRRLPHPCRTSAAYIHFDLRLKLFGPSRLCGTMASADFLQFVVTMASLCFALANSTCKTSRDKPLTFPRLPARSTPQSCGYLLDFTASCQLIRLSRLISGFCSTGHDFAIPSSRLHLTIQTLGVTFGFVGNYAPWDFHPSFGTCPTFQKKDLMPYYNDTRYKNHILFPDCLMVNPSVIVDVLTRIC